MIDIQKQVQDMIKIKEEANILGISEDLWYLIQSNMEDQAYQV